MPLLDKKTPGEIFSGNAGSLKQEFDKLALQYHPDVNRSPTANDEFIHLQHLYKLAKEMFQQEFWEDNRHLRFGKYKVRFLRKIDLPIGKMYVGDTHITFLIDKKYQKLYDNAIERIKGLKYKTDRMKEEISRYLPAIRTTYSLPGYEVLVIHKTPDLILLRDIPFTGMADRDRHVAWIMSTLHNLRCYFEVAGITHNDISLDTYFISPKYHSGALLGGWWYSREVRDSLLAVPNYAYDLCSDKMKTKRKADYTLDKELVKALGRELLGDRGGANLSNSAPAAFVNWLRCSTSKSAIEEYSLWDKVLEESYGKRKFIKMNISTKSIYEKGAN